MTPQIRRAAKRDILEAARWYEDQQPGLGEAFVTEVDACLARIGGRPEAFPMVLKDARRLSLRRFPYSVYFRVRNGKAHILAVVHQARDPRVWTRRVR